MDEDNWIPVQLRRVIVRDKSDQQWIYLEECEGHRGFPILIATHEAWEIHRVAAGIATERPLTHALAHGIIEALEGQLERVEIVDLQQNTFYAHLVLRRSGGELCRVDARPSDALALGLRSGCEIRVAESILERVRTDKEGPDSMPGQAEGGPPQPPQPPGPSGGPPPGPPNMPDL